MTSEATSRQWYDRQPVTDPNRYNIITFPPCGFDFNGIQGPKRPAEQYESYCLLYVVELYNDAYTVIGPNFLNKSIPEKVPSKNGSMSVPDMLVLKGVVLRALFEVKSGKDLALDPKLSGFAFLLNQLRSNTELLGQILEPLAPYINLAEQPIVPANSEIEIFFMTPLHLDRLIPANSHGFSCIKPIHVPKT